MTREDLRYANELNDCLDQLKDLKAQFLKDFPQVNNCGSSRLTDEVLALWKEANTTVLEQCIEQISQDFEEL